jgi:hypothetical protein
MRSKRVSKKWYQAYKELYGEQMELEGSQDSDVKNKSR